MKNNLLLTTALVALSMPAYAADYVGGDIQLTNYGMGSLDGTSYPGFALSANSLTANGVTSALKNATADFTVSTKGEYLKFLYGNKDTDINTALELGIKIGDSSESINEKISAAIEQGYMVRDLIYFAQTTEAEQGYVDVSNSSLTLDSISLKANKVNFNGSNIFVENTVGASGKTEIIATTTANNTHFDIKDNANLDLSDAVIKEVYSDNDGGAIYNKGTLTISDSEFNGNTASVEEVMYGGAIFSKGQGLNISGTDFVENVAYSGGALYESNSSPYSNENTKGMVLTDVTFDRNHAAADGGALGIGLKAELTNVTFKDNTAGLSINGVVTKAVDVNGGGAIMLNEKAKATMEKVWFYGNKSGVRGGAIEARHQNKGLLEIKTAQFKGNIAAEDGGAISSIYNGVINIEDATFANNEAGGKGGAIYVSYADNFIGFDDPNQVYESTNGGVLNLTGTNIFSGNTAAGELNDIYSSGTINVSGNLTLDGGIAGTGVVNFNEGSVLTINLGKTTIAANEVNIVGSKLIFNNDVAAKVYDFVEVPVTQDGTFKQNGTFTIDVENGLYNIEHKGDGKIYVEAKSTDELSSSLGASTTEASALLAVTSKTDTNNQYFNDVADALSVAAQSGDATAVKEAAKLGADANPIVSSQEAGSHDVLFGVVSNELNGDSGAMAGMSSGDVFKKASAWIRGLFNKADHEATSKSSGFNADTYGVAMGIDKEINSDTRLGFGYANSQTDIESAGRDTDVDTNSFFVYSQYKPANWYVNTILAYSWSEYDETKSVMGVNAGAKYDVDTIALQSMYGYETKFKGHDLTPEFGFRYLHINQDAYTDKLGTTVAENSEDVLTLVAGAKVAKNYTLENGAVLRPELRAAVTYDLFDADNSANVALANGASYVVDGEKLNRLGFEFGAKVATNVTDKVEVSAGYLTRVREDYQDHTVTFDARYNF